MRARTGKGTAPSAGSLPSPARSGRIARAGRGSRSARLVPSASSQSASSQSAPAQPSPEQSVPVAMLRPWRLDDAAGLQAAFTVSGDLAAQFGAIELSTIARCQSFIADNLAPATVSRQNFAISIDGVAVGNVGIGSMEHRHGTGWVYYWVSAEARGRGLATLALASIADWAFTEQGLHRLELGHRTNNPASCRVAAKAGFVFEGIERQKLKYGSERFDVETHARLRTDAPPPVRPLPLVTF
ncbi:GNAT family protein [Cryobacterium sp. SO2]|uniref:GNAT family N-acetyltransferase n=1 Tax=Cryobacterium sp. SO2 TaxID=1897060 RepID=UPI00223C8DCF|nr:GNAT family protein [Cryobacterium sp. SO2]WEO77445.1 GNAT family protein [Cryobacterium sp. SO2]